MRRYSSLRASKRCELSLWVCRPAQMSSTSACTTDPNPRGTLSRSACSCGRPSAGVSKSLLASCTAIRRRPARTSCRRSTQCFVKGGRFNLNHFVPLPATPQGKRYLRGDSVTYLSQLDARAFAQSPFYLFALFLIKHLRTLHAGWLLPSTFQSWLTELLNSRVLAPFYQWCIRLSIWIGYYRFAQAVR